MKHGHVYLLIAVVIIIFIPVFLILQDIKSDDNRGRNPGGELVIEIDYFDIYYAFKDLCEFTKGIFYDDCDSRTSEFCGLEYNLDNRFTNIACACPEDMSWRLDVGCQDSIRELLNDIKDHFCYPENYCQTAEYVCPDGWGPYSTGRGDCACGCGSPEFFASLGKQLLEAGE